MHNNFLIDRTGKMSKSSGEFLRLQTLVDRGFHPLAYRLMCLQAHYRSEMEFTWEGLAAAFVRLKRMVAQVAHWRLQTGVGSSIDEQIVDYRHSFETRFDEAIISDLNTATALVFLEEVLSAKAWTLSHDDRNWLIFRFDEVLAFKLRSITRADLRIRPVSATLTEVDIEARLDERKAARAAKDFATSDRIRDELIAAGVEVMDGDPLGWDWKIVI
jgi:cysteinyl-tRNA synthetase